MVTSTGHVGVMYPVYRMSPITTKEYVYDRFPPTANDLGTNHPVLDTIPPLLAEEQGSPT
jgi:hypothetical protein